MLGLYAVADAGAPILFNCMPVGVARTRTLLFCSTENCSPLRINWRVRGVQGTAFQNLTQATWLVSIRNLARAFFIS